MSWLILDKKSVLTELAFSASFFDLTASLSGKSFQKIRLSEAAFGVRGDADFSEIKLYKEALTDSELITLTTI
jgi:hypothetical protein